MKTQHDRALRGFTLLEIILALAILAGSLAALGEVMRVADLNAAKARDETDAAMLADSVMSELVSGARTLGKVSETAFDLDTEPPWVYSIAIDSTDYEQLVAVRVVVAQQLAPELQPARCELIRWMPNPDYVSSTESQSSQSGSNSTSGTGNSSQSSGSTSASRSSNQSTQ